MVAPTQNSAPLPAEEFELAEAGPSTLPSETPPRRRPSWKAPRRTLTLHRDDTSATLLFAAPNSSSLTPRKRQVRTFSLPGSPNGTPVRPAWDHFLSDDRIQSVGENRDDGGRVEVHVPDFSTMLGEEVDHFYIAGSMRNPLKRRLYLLMEEPSSSREAFFVHVLVTGGILFSAALTTFSTLPAFHTESASIKALFGLDTTIVILFTIEYIARSIAHSDSWSQYYKWATSFFPLLDLIAIFPYYIEVARQQDTSILFRFSILRTFRLLRVFRAFKYQNQMLLTIEVMYVAVQRSKDALVALSFFILLVLVLFSTLIYFAERGTWDAAMGGFVDADGDPSLFDSIPRTAWFALVTMSTVGYGDVVPRSFLGKLLTVPLLMFGLLLIALPSFVLGRNFAIVFDAMTSQAAKGPSLVGSARESMEEPRPANTISANSGPGASAPLLPTTIDQLRASVSETPAARRDTPRMWDGPGASHPAATATVTREMMNGDLTNKKLAKNQLVLLSQIDSLRKQIENQTEMMSRLMLHLDPGAPVTLPLDTAGSGLGIQIPNGHPASSSRTSQQVERGAPPDPPYDPPLDHSHGANGDEKQFALGEGDSEEERP